MLSLTGEWLIVIMAFTIHGFLELKTKRYRPVNEWHAIVACAKVLWRGNYTSNTSASVLSYPFASN